MIKAIAKIAPLILLISLFTVFTFQSNIVNADYDVGSNIAQTGSIPGNDEVGEVLLFHRFLATGSGKITGFDVFAGYTVAGVYASSPVIYSDSGGNPASLLGTGSSQAMGAAFQWWSLTGLNVSITAGSYYWLGVTTDYTGGAGTYLLGYGLGTGSTVWSTYTGGSLGTYNVCAYATVYSDSLTVSNIASSSSAIATNTTMTAYWSTNATLKQYTFSWNYSGSVVNETYTLSGSTAWTNVTKSLGYDLSTVGSVVQWQIWAWTTNLTYVTTGLQNITLTLPTVTTTNYFAPNIPFFPTDITRKTGKTRNNQKQAPAKYRTPRVYPITPAAAFLNINSRRKNK